MQKIVIPNRFREEIDKDPLISSNIASLVSIIGPIYYENNVEFFPEYTDHGLNHINDVLFYCNLLITNDGFKRLKSRDIASLVTAVLFHDLAMHMTTHQFKSLIENSDEIEIRSDFCKNIIHSSWKDIWASYLLKIEMYSDEYKLMNFGSSNSIAMIPDDSNKWDYSHRLVIGNFLREHHASLALEMLYNGTSFYEKLANVSDMPSEMRLISGFIARSHGFDLRDQIDIIFGQDREMTYGIHMPFLMALIRVADYLQIQSDRAPKISYFLRKLVSQTSNNEWHKHFAIIDSSFRSKSFYVKCKPNSLRELLELREFLNSIKQEIQISNKVLDGIYNNDEELRLSIIDLESNIEPGNEFLQNLDFVDRKFRVIISNEDMINLLTTPSFRVNGESSINHAISRAVNACLENKDFKSPKKISVTIEDKYLVISDNGRGKNPDGIEETYLKIGLNKIELERKNKTSVQILADYGILSYFIIGDEIKVSSKQTGATNGYEFITKIDDELIELRKSKVIENGNRIAIRLKERIDVEKLFSERNLTEYARLVPNNIEISFILSGELLKSAEKVEAIYTYSEGSKVVEVSKGKSTSMVINGRAAFPAKDSNISIQYPNLISDIEFNSRAYIITVHDHLTKQLKQEDMDDITTKVANHIILQDKKSLSEKEEYWMENLDKASFYHEVHNDSVYRTDKKTKGFRIANFHKRGRKYYSNTTLTDVGDEYIVFYSNFTHRFSQNALKDLSVISAYSYYTDFEAYALFHLTKESNYKTLVIVDKRVSKRIIGRYRDISSDTLITHELNGRWIAIARVSDYDLSELSILDSRIYTNLIHDMNSQNNIIAIWKKR